MLFGGHVRGRPKRRELGASAGLVLQLRQPEVQHQDPAIVGDHDVVGLEVEVHEVLSMRGGQTETGLSHHRPERRHVASVLLAPRA